MNLSELNTRDDKDLHSLKVQLHALSLLASKSPKGVVITDTQTRIEWVNDGFISITGYPPADVMGKNALKILFECQFPGEKIQEISELINGRKQFQKEVLSRTKQGKDLWLSIECIPLFNERNEVLKIVFIQDDITEKKKNEAELIKLSKDLTKQNSNLQQFTYIVSHNLRAPLASALGITELIKTIGPNDAFYNEGINLLEQSLKNLDDVITDINRVLSVQSTTEQFEEINLFSLCRDVILSLQKQILDEDADVKIAIDKDFTLLSINAYLHSILLNLISNAIKYRSSERGLKIKISAIRRGNENLLFVSDNGIGIDLTQHRNQLFRLYKRFTPHIEGKGLGLYLVKTQVEELGGKIEVESIPNMGTSFIVRLPDHI